MKPRIVIRKNASRDDVTIIEEGQSTVIDRSQLDVAGKNKLARMLNKAWRISRDT